MEFAQAHLGGLASYPHLTEPSFKSSIVLTPDSELTTYRQNNTIAWNIPASGFINPNTLRVSFLTRVVDRGYIISGQAAYEADGALTAGGNTVLECVIAGVAAQAFVPAGEYLTIFTLVAAINTALAAAVLKSNGLAATNMRGIVASYNAETALISFTQSIGAAGATVMNWNIVSSIGWMLGFGGVDSASIANMNLTPLTTWAPWFKRNYRFQNNIASILDRLKITYGSNILEEICDHGSLVRLLTDLSVESLGGENSIGSNIGYTDHRRDIASSIRTTWQRFETPLECGLTGQKRLLPMKYLTEGALRIELTLRLDKDCMVSDAGQVFTPRLEYSEFELHYDLYEFVPVVEEAIYKEIKGGYKIPFVTGWLDKFSCLHKNDRYKIKLPQVASAKTILAGLYTTAGMFADSDCTFSYGRPSKWAATTGLELSSTFIGTAPAYSTSIVAGSPTSFLRNYQFRMGQTLDPIKPIRVHDSNVSVSTMNYSGNACNAYSHLTKALQRGVSHGSKLISGYQWANPYWQIQTGFAVAATNPLSLNQLNRDIVNSTVQGNQSLRTNRLTDVACPLFIMAADLMNYSAPGITTGTQAELLQNIELLLEFGDTPGNDMYVRMYSLYDRVLEIRPHCEVTIFS